MICLVNHFFLYKLLLYIKDALEFFFKQIDFLVLLFAKMLLCLDNKFESFKEFLSLFISSMNSSASSTTLFKFYFIDSLRFSSFLTSFLALEICLLRRFFICKYSSFEEIPLKVVSLSLRSYIIVVLMVRSHFMYDIYLNLSTITSKNYE